MIVSQIKADDRTPIVARQANLAEPERPHEGVNVGGESALVVTVIGRQSCPDREGLVRLR